MDNVAISPYSAVNAIVLLSQMANGTALDQLKLRSRLNFTGTESDLLVYYTAYQQSITESARNSTFIVANKLYVQQGYQINPRFQEVVTEKLLSGIDSVDFTNSTEAAKIINGFVAEATQNRTGDIIKPESLNANTQIILMNSIYMKLSFEKVYQSLVVDHYWYNYFSTEYPHIVTYYEDIEYVCFVNGLFKYAELNDLHAQAIEIGFADSDQSLLLILPDLLTDLSELEATMKNYNLSSIVERMQPEKVYVRLPTFQINYQISLKDIANKVC